ncbi:hypothetical protein [Streptomyces bottropensis]|uniref:hypothetical protein n=1 Tax=Streptomyces bottropensis TaxID=42235 RepID=UPI003673F7EF
MSTSLFAPAVQPASVFPPPSTPLLLADGDRYEWPATGDLWVRVRGDWRPMPDDGSGYLTDAEVRAMVHRAVVNWDVKHRFVPVAPGAILPGKRLHSLLDLRHLDLGAARSVAQYIRSVGNGNLVPMRDLVAEHDDDMANGFRRTITVPDALHLLDVILAEQERPEVSYDEAAGRLYARYERYVEGCETWMFPPTVECLHVFVLSAAPAEA